MEVSLIPIGIAASRVPRGANADVVVDFALAASATDPSTSDQQRGEFPAILARFVPPLTSGTRTNPGIQTSTTAHSDQTPALADSTSVKVGANTIETPPHVQPVNSRQNTTLAMSIARQHLRVSKSGRRPVGHNTPLEVERGSIKPRAVEKTQVDPSPYSERIVPTLGGDLTVPQSNDGVMLSTPKNAGDIDSDQEQFNDLTTNNDQRASDEHRFAATSLPALGTFHEDKIVEANATSSPPPSTTDVPSERHRRPNRTPGIDGELTGGRTREYYDAEAATTVHLGQQRNDTKPSGRSIGANRSVEAAVGSVLSPPRTNETVPRGAAPKPSAFDDTQRSSKPSVATTTSERGDNSRNTEIQVKSSVVPLDESGSPGLTDSARVKGIVTNAADSGRHSADEASVYGHPDVEHRSQGDHLEPPRTASVRPSVGERVTKPLTAAVSEMSERGTSRTVSADALSMLEHVRATHKREEVLPRPTDSAVHNESGARTVGAAHLPTENMGSRGVPEPTLATQIAQPIIEQTRTGTSNEHRQLRVQLRPPELGEVVIRLEETQTGIAARIVVANEAALHVLESNLSDLLRSLGESGIELSSFQLSRNDKESEHENDRSILGRGDDTTLSSSNQRTDATNLPGVQTHRVNVIA